MLTLNASSLRATLNETGSPLAGPPMATPPPPDTRDPAGFASLLRQTQAAAPAHAPAPTPEPMPGPQAQAAAAPAPKPEPANEAGAAHDSAAPNSRASAAPEGKARERAAAATPTRRAKPADAAGNAQHRSATGHDKSDRAASATVVNAAANPTAAPPALDPSLLQWLAGQQRGSAAAPDAAAATGTPPGDPTPTADAGAAAASGTAPGRRVIDLKADAALSAKGAQGTLQLNAGAREGGLAAVLVDQHLGGKPAKSSTEIAGFKDIAAAAAALAPPVATPPGAAAPLTVAIATPVAAPQFAQSLGLQMSVLARNGVQHAELHLNPADMGPVSVHIVMDGSQARVDFGADVAATRHAIEAGLPELASALRDAGFTLAGGGVSQHSRGRGDGTGNDTPSDPGHAAGAQTIARTEAGAHAAVRRLVRIGGLDLYA